MPKKKVGVKKRQKGSVTRPRTTTTKSGAKSRTRTTAKAPVWYQYLLEDDEALQELLPVLGADLTLTPSVPAVAPLGTEQSVTSVDTKGSYPITVRQANALLAELGHRWIADHEVINLLTDLGKWIDNKE